MVHSVAPSGYPQPRESDQPLSVNFWRTTLVAAVTPP